MTSVEVLDNGEKAVRGDIDRIRRITGYLTGDKKGWNDAKKAEEEDRVKHDIPSNK